MLIEEDIKRIEEIKKTFSRKSRKSRNVENFIKKW